MPFGVLSSLCNYEVTRRIREIILGVNPTYIPGCQYWFDAADATTIITSGGNITQWSDKSGFGRHATQYNTSPATYSTNGFNGLPTVVFGGSTPGYSAPSPIGTFPKGNGITVFVVFNAALSQPNSFVALINKSVNNFPDSFDIYNDSRLVGPYGAAPRQYSTINIKNCTSPGLYDFTVDGSTNPIWAENLFGGSGSGATYYTSTPFSSQAYDICGTKLYIGTRADNNISFNGNISEIIVYNTALPTGARQLIEGYLAAKWGLQSQLPTTHPYYSAQPNMYFPQLPLWWYKFLASDISYSSPTSTFVAYNYGTLQYDGSMNGWAVTGPTDGLAVDNAANLGVEPSSLRFGNGTPYISSITSNTQWMQWPSISSVSNYYTLAYVLKYVDTTDPGRVQRHWTMNNVTNYTNGLIATNPNGTSLFWWNMSNSVFNMNNLYDGNPHHFAFVFGPSNFQPQIYLDASALLVPSTLSAPYNTITSNILGFNYSSWQNAYINAWLGETRLYNFAMNAAQVNTLYNLMMDYTVPQPPITITGVTAVAGNVYSTGTSTTNGVQYSVYVFTSSTTNPSTPQYTINYNCTTATQCYVLAVGGGGGGAAGNGGGGGAGGVVMNPVTLPVGSNTITVAVGAGGTGGIFNSGPPVTYTAGSSGYNTYVNFNVNSSYNITAYGGGYGGTSYYGSSDTRNNGYSGGSSGGTSNFSNVNLTSPANISYNNNYGNSGGSVYNKGYTGAGGGGGAGTIGLAISSSTNGIGPGGNGGSGIQCFLPGIRDFTITSTVTNNAYSVSNIYWGGGGGGSAQSASPTNGGNGGIGGGGGGYGSNNINFGTGGSYALNSGQTANTIANCAGNGGVNTGGGGGGSFNKTGGNGGSGIVIIAFPQTAPVTTPTNSVLTNANLSTIAYNSLCGAFACNLVNYNYYGPMMTLRAPVDVSGQYTQNFYADTYGNMGTQYLGTGTSFTSWIKTPISMQNINGCVIWLDAASSSSITITSGKVSQWVDKTSNAFTFTQSTDINRPTYVANSLNGLPTLQFTASNSTFLGGPTNFAVGTNSFSLFAVCKFNDTTSAGSIFNKSLYGGGTGRIIMVRDLGDISLNILVTDSVIGAQKIKETYPANTYRILELVYNRSAGTCEVYNNGTLIGSKSTTDTSNLTNTYNMIIGGYNDSLGGMNPPWPGLYLDGNIAEIVAFSNPYDMTTATRQQIEGYLANKWGLQSMLPTNHPALNTSYAYVTKWYDQGMDFSFNCATQYTTGSQPIYDVSFKLLNFGYQGSGGGVSAPQTSCFFNLPDYSVPYDDGSYTIALKHYNITGSVTFFHGGNSSASNYMNELRWDSGDYANGWNGNRFGAGSGKYNPNNIVVSKYEIGTLGYRYMYINDISYSGYGDVLTSRLQPPTTNYIGSGTSNNTQFQMYYMYIFGTALNDQDRTTVENVNYYNSVNNIISNTNLIMYYPMESGDISSNGYLANWAFGSPIYDANMVNSPTIVSNSRIVGGSAMSFTANSSYLKLPDFTPTTNGLTFSVWINVNIATGIASRIFDIGLGQRSSNILILFNNSNVLEFHCYYIDTKSSTPITIPISYTNNWVHIVWCLPYSAPGNQTSNWIIYTNGSVTNNTYNGYYPDPSITRTSNYIAKSNWSDPSYNGYIDDFRVYNRVLSAAEVQQLYYGQGWNYIPQQIQTIKNSISLVSTYLLTMYYPMESTDINGTYLANWALGTPIYDASLVNTPTISTNSRIVGGSSMSFSAASSQYIQLPNFTPTNNGLTFSVWYNSVNTGNYGRIFEFGTSVANSSSIVLSSNAGGTNYLDFEVYSKSGILKYINLNDTNYNDGKWRHVAWTLTYDISSSPTSVWKIYINGILHPQSTTTGYYPDTSVTRTFNYIGKSTNSADAPYNGFIDDFRVYNRVLTPTEVQTLYYSQGANYIPQNVNLYYNSISVVSTTGLVMYYPLEATDTSGGYLANWALGTPIYDASMVNSPTTSTDIKVSGTSAMRFISANSQYLTLSSFTPTYNGLTFSFWIDCNNTIQYSTIFDFGRQLANTNNIVCAVNNNSILALYGYVDTVNVSSAYDLGPYNIGSPWGTTGPDTTARWIWSTSDASYSFPSSMYPQVRFFKTFTSATAYTGTLYYAVDDRGHIYMNGQKVIANIRGGWNTPISPSVSVNVVAGSNTITIDAWNTGGPAGLIASLYNGASLVLHTDSTWNFYKYYVANTAGGTTTTTLTKNINDNTWHHVVWSMSVADSNYSTTWNIYVDASNVYSNTFLNSSGYRYPYSYTMLNNYIGGTIDSSNNISTSFGFNNGYIDDFRVYNRVLTPTEVQTLYYSQGSNYIPQNVNLYYNSISVVSTTGLLMYYPLETTDTSGGYLANWAFGTPIYDASMVNSPTTSTDMKVVGTSAMRFVASSSQYIALQNFTPTTNGLSFSVWYNAVNTGQWTRIFEFGNGASNSSITMSPNGANTNKLSFEIFDSIGTRLTFIQLPDASYNDSTWRHVVWTLTYASPSSNTSTSKVYVNGQIKSPTPITNAYYPDPSVTRILNYIGKSNSNDPYYNGFVDDFRVYNRVLSDSEVQTLYNSQGANYILPQTTTGTVHLIGYQSYTINGLYTIYAYTNVQTVNNAITVTNSSNSVLPLYVLCVAGGGSGGSDQAGGGGGGGVIQNTIILKNSDTISITVGDGGNAITSGSNCIGGNGYPSSLSFTTNTTYNITALGGGGGGSYTSINGFAGGSGGGGGATLNTPGTGGSGTAGQGNSGGAGWGGGGGAGTSGTAGFTSPATSGQTGGGGNGGDGIKCNLTGIVGSIYGNYYWGGGGGGGYTGSLGNLQQNTAIGGKGGKGGGGGGSVNSGTVGVGDTNGINSGANGTVGLGQVGGKGGTNTGGGGGGSSQNNGTPGGKGGSGIVLVAVLTSTIV